MKKLIMYFFFTLSSSLLAFSQGTWSPRTSLPDSARGEGISFAIGNYGYAGLGENYEKHPYEFYDDFWQFNPSTNSWTRKGNFPGKARVWPAYFVIGNYAYVVTGYDSALKNELTECWQYNPTTDKWVQKANFPGVPRAYGVGFAIGGKGYVGLGTHLGYLNDFWAYDTATDTWAAIANFAGTARYCTSAFGVGGKGYVCYGQDQTGKLYRDMWAYDTANNTWTRKSNNPGDSLYGTSGFVIGSKIYVGTGSDNGAQLYHIFWQYNTVTDAWKQQANFPDIRAACFSFSVGDSGYFGLGWDTVANVVYSNGIYRFVPDTTTTISELLNYSNQIAVYPNPFTISCFISLNDYGTHYLELDDITGRTLKKFEFTGNTYTLSADGLAKGMYFIRVLDNDKNAVGTSKIVIQ